MQALRKRALSTAWGRKPWATPEAFTAISSATYRTAAGVTVELDAPIHDVAAVLNKALKPGRQLLTAVRYGGGKIEELPAGAPALEEKASVEIVAATVAAPEIGCPTPEWPEADIRANRVLEAFLDPEQLDDYRRRGAFVAVGHDTGHRYLITHRERPAAMRHVSYRSLYDLDEQRALCLHDWTVPPAEEAAAILFCVTLPGRESLVRGLVELHA